MKKYITSQVVLYIITPFPSVVFMFVSVQKIICNLKFHNVQERCSTTQQIVTVKNIYMVMFYYSNVQVVLE